ncbi:retrotransposon protein, putative, ty1-copia subclass [Tanacetum coccineum]|uniref:Retrotransposon protein, putative, ty1-copia subclass n=1 Tax=Tanacetum coccineum TaxID=301880 RepID=A0ABQ5C138_9ASTR
MSERRNHTLLDMVRSMMNLITLPLSFWDYALESATRIVNMVPTKKVDKTPYELWYGKVPNLSYLKVWGCEALVKKDTPEKLQQRSVECIFVGYPNETIEVSGRAVELEEIQDEDTSPSKITSEIPMEVEGFEPSQDKVIPVCRSVRTHQAHERLCLNVEVEEHSLGDLNEPTNYKVALLYPKSNKWLDAMNAEMQSMKDNQVLRLIDLPPNGKIVGSKWIFKKKTNMDGKVHTYKARLVAKGYTQTYGVDYEETFSPVADIRATRILIAIAAFYDYEIWQMDVNTAFLNGASTPEEVKCMQNVPYASTVGSIMYVVRCTRPDVAFAQNIISRFQQNLGEPHWTAVKTILKYLRNTKDMFFAYGGNPKAELRVDCYCDAGFETDRDDIKSQIGYVFILIGGAVINPNRSKFIQKVMALHLLHQSEDSATMILLSKTAVGVANGIVMLKMVSEIPLQFGVVKRLSRTFRAESTGLLAEATKMLWAESVSTTYLIYRTSYVMIGLEAKKCTFIDSDSDEMGYSRDTKSHQVIQSRDITFVDSIYEARSCLDAVAFACVILSLLLEDNLCDYDYYVNIMCTGRPLGEVNEHSLRIVLLRLIWTSAWPFRFIMPPRMTTRSAGRATATPRGGRTGGRTGRRGGRTRGRSGD